MAKLFVMIFSTVPISRGCFMFSKINSLELFKISGSVAWIFIAYLAFAK